MGSIEAGRPPDGDSCSDEDENPTLSRAEQDNESVPFRQSLWIPIAQNFRPYVRVLPGRPRGMGTGISMQNHGRTEGSHSEEQTVVTRRVRIRIRHPRSPHAASFYNLYLSISDVGKGESPTVASLL